MDGTPMDQDADYYPDFELPAWFAGPEHLHQLLKNVWDCGYDIFVAPRAARRPECDLDEMCGQLVAALWTEGSPLGYQRFLYLGWALALGAAPTIAWRAPED